MLTLCAALNFALFIELALPVGFFLVLFPYSNCWQTQCLVLGLATCTMSPPRIVAALCAPPFVPTPHSDLIEILSYTAQRVRYERDTFLELGSGDGRNLLVAVQSAGFQRALGVEQNPLLVCASLARAWWGAAYNQVSVLRGDILAVTLPQPAPSVIYLYLSRDLIAALAPRLTCAYGGQKRRPIVLSRDFQLTDWGEPLHSLERGPTVLRAYHVPVPATPCLEDEVEETAAPG